MELDWQLGGWLAKHPKENIWAWKGLIEPPGETHEALTHCETILYMAMLWKSSITWNMVYARVQFYWKVTPKSPVFNSMQSCGAFLVLIICSKALVPILHKLTLNHCVFFSPASLGDEYALYFTPTWRRNFFYMIFNYILLIPNHKVPWEVSFCSSPCRIFESGS